MHVPLSPSRKRGAGDRSRLEIMFGCRESTGPSTTKARGPEYGSARAVQPRRGYTQWRRFESATKKAMTSREPCPVARRTNTLPASTKLMTEGKGAVHARGAARPRGAARTCGRGRTRTGRTKTRQSMPNGASGVRVLGTPKPWSMCSPHTPRACAALLPTRVSRRSRSSLAGGGWDGVVA